MKKYASLFICLMLLIGVSCTFANDKQRRVKSEVRAYLQADVPEGVTDMRINIVYPYAGYTQYYAYIKLTMPQTVYEQLMQSMSMRPADSHFWGNGSWEPKVEKGDVMFAWWNPSLAEKQLSTMYQKYETQQQPERLTYAKYEMGNAFIVVNGDRYQ